MILNYGKYDLYYENDGCYIGNFEIFENFRGKKLSYKLLKNAIDNGGNTLIVKTSNTIAIHVYEKCGFKIFKTYYTKDLGEVHLMKLNDLKF